MVEVLHDCTFIPVNWNQGHNPERVRCTPNEFTKTMPDKHNSTLVAMYGRRQRSPPFNELITRLHDFELHLIPIRACVYAISKVTERLDWKESNQVRHDGLTVCSVSSRWNQWIWRDTWWGSGLSEHPTGGTDQIGIVPSCVIQYLSY